MDRRYIARDPGSIPGSCLLYYGVPAAKPSNNQHCDQERLTLDTGPQGTGADPLFVLGWWSCWRRPLDEPQREPNPLYCPSIDGFRITAYRIHTHTRLDLSYKLGLSPATRFKCPCRGPLLGNDRSRNMAPFKGSRNLRCFYCNRPSKLRFDGVIRDFLCLHCDATNYLDEVCACSRPHPAARM